MDDTYGRQSVKQQQPLGRSPPPLGFGRLRCRSSNLGLRFLVFIGWMFFCVFVLLAIFDEKRKKCGMIVANKQSVRKNRGDCREERQFSGILRRAVCVLVGF